jgi:putative tryptophan/tyrosine transport system substrate-binding protein
MIRRRQFITLLGGVAVTWPLAARAQQPQHMRRVGVLMNLAADDLEGQARQAAFLQGLQEVGWAVGRNLRIDIRWGNNDPDRIRRNVAELVATAPDVILAAANPVIAALQAATSTVPIVFAAVVDPIVAGFVASLNRPGGNMTGFTTIEHGISAKWLELLKDVAPRVKHVAVLFHPSNPSGQPQVSAIQAVAPSLAVELTPIHLRDAGEFERAVTAFAQTPNSGLIVTLLSETIQHRELILTLAARHRLPAVYGLRVFAAEGGLIAYGADVVDQFRRAAEYVDRILKGAKPADLPVQAPVKFELVINLKTAKALGLEVPATLLARADEVIE